jgi:hypothetical protein
VNVAKFVFLMQRMIIFSVGENAPVNQQYISRTRRTPCHIAIFIILFSFLSPAGSLLPRRCPPSQNPAAAPPPRGCRARAPLLLALLSAGRRRRSIALQRRGQGASSLFHSFWNQKETQERRVIRGRNLPSRLTVLPHLRAFRGPRVGEIQPQDGSKP